MYARLVQILGRRQAKLEHGWMLRAGGDLDAMVARRVAGEPLQYILGTQPFGPLNLLVRPPVLIPRPETEHWVLRVADEFKPRAPIRMLDLGTGTGCIPLLLCHLWPQGLCAAHAVDISPHALRLARDNAALCGVPETSERENTLVLSGANILAESFIDRLRINAPLNLITSNPPYIPWGEFLRLPASVVDYEDARALFGGPSGLEFYHAIARLVSRQNILASDGIVALEVGHDQASAVESILHDTGRFRETAVWLDPWGKQRTVIARAM